MPRGKEILVSITFNAVRGAVSLERGQTEAVLLVVDHLALRVSVAVAAFHAQGLALLHAPVAVLPLSTVRVLAALHLQTLDIWVALEAGPAVALGTVVVDATIGISPAGGCQAGIYAFLVDAGLARRTVGVDLALDWKHGKLKEKGPKALQDKGNSQV